MMTDTATRLDLISFWDNAVTDKKEDDEAYRTTEERKQFHAVDYFLIELDRAGFRISR